MSSSVPASPSAKGEELDADVSPSAETGGSAAQELDRGDTSPPQVLQAAQEPIPIELAQVIPDVQLHPPDDDGSEEEDGAQAGTTPDDEQDTSGGAWSTTITPVEEIEGFDLHIKEEGDAEVPEANNQPPRRTRPAHLSHSRIESLPPQRFSELDVEDVGHSQASSSRLPSSLSSNGRSSGRRPSGLSNVSMDEDEEIDLDAQHRYYPSEGTEGMQSLSETERAGLDFVDVALDGKKGIYGSAGASHAKSRTSLEIRSDFLSSDGVKGTAPPMSRSGSGQDLGVSPSGIGNGGIRLPFWKRSSLTSQGDKSEGDARNDAETGGTDIGTSSKGAATPTREAVVPSNVDQGDMGSMSRSSSLGSVTEPSRKVAGRYRGRISTPTSPATSPHIERNPTIFGGGHAEPSGIPALPRRFSEAMTMMVANEDGEVEVIDLGSEGHTASHQGQAFEKHWRDTVSKPVEDGSRSVGPSANTSATQNGTKPQRGGRSAGPVFSDGSVSTETGSGDRDTTNDTSVTTSLSKGGRSAGPILEGAEIAASTPSPATPSASAMTSKSTGGRSAGPIIDEPSTSQPSGHTRKLSKGPSALEAHISRTRQTTLPPKARNEDQRHLKDFELMMKESKLSEAKKAKEDEARQRKKEEEQREAIKVWEGEILKDWRVARSSTRLRDYWWKGSPPALRGKAWQLAIGNAQMLARNLCQTTKTRVADLKGSGSWPPTNAFCEGEEDHEIDVQSLIEEDIDRTLPSLKLFQREGGVMYDDLKEILDCLVLIRADQAKELARERGRKESKGADEQKSVKSSNGLSPASKAAAAPQLYAPGLSLLCATLLLNLSQAETLVAILNLIASKAWLRSIYSMDPEHLKESEAFERVLDTFLADQLPKVYANMQARGVRPSAFARDWVRNLFVPLLPFDVVCRLWDNIFLEESDSLIFRTCLALVSLLSSRLYAPDAAELTSILQGRNRAALAVWYRGLHSAPGSAKDPASAQVVASLPTPTSPESAASPLSAILERPTGTHGLSANNSISETDNANTEDADGGNHDTSSVEAPASWVPRDCLFTTYGINEDNLFRGLEEQVGIDGWFKETTLERLIGRELGG